MNFQAQIDIKPGCLMSPAMPLSDYVRANFYLDVGKLLHVRCTIVDPLIPSSLHCVISTESKEYITNDLVAR